jgi:hypothetical protein
MEIAIGLRVAERTSLFDMFSGLMLDNNSFAAPRRLALNRKSAIRREPTTIIGGKIQWDPMDDKLDGAAVRPQIHLRQCSHMHEQKVAVRLIS